MTAPRGSSPLQAGDIQFYDNYCPDLPVGNYEIKVEQTVSFTQKVVVNGVEKDKPQSYRLFQTQALAVVAPRFTLDSGDVHAIFPPANSQGEFEKTLPHIVLTKRYLPWARLLDGGLCDPKYGKPNIPWLALLVLDPSELRPPPGDPKTTNPNKLTRDWGLTVSQLQTPETGVFRPSLKLASYEDADAQCRVIDLTPDTFTKLTPRLCELPYLAHCRQVNTGNKVIEGLDEQGWFSIVIGNRLPSPTIKPKGGGDAQPGNLNIAHLVSLEGFEPYLADQPHWPTGTLWVRLVSLASWVFTCLPDQGQSFASLMSNLIASTGTAGDALLFRSPKQVKGSTLTPAQQEVQKRLNSGYVPLGYQTRAGEKTFAWYRGPFAPAPVAPFPDNKPFLSAGEAVSYDPKTGIFDQSYGVAWQIGRQLALSDKSFALNLLKWRRKSHRLIDLLLERLKSKHLQALLDQPDAVADLNTLLDQQLVTDLFLTTLVNDLQASQPQTSPVEALSMRRTAAVAEGKYRRSVSPEIERLRQLVTQPRTRRVFTPGGLVVQTVSTSTHQQLQDLLKDADVQNLLVSLNNPQVDPIIEQIVGWLAKLALLHDVPFEYLALTAELLPPESVRLFYVDPNWLNCAIDGALSIGLQSSRDLVHDEIMRAPLKDAASKMLIRVRDILAGMTPTDGKDVTGSIAGMLLRSAVVAGWPGLQLRAFANVKMVTKDSKQVPTPDGLLKPLRIDRLSPNVLLCLWPQVPAWIELDEPAEGFHFGVEDNQKPEESKYAIVLRSIDPDDLQYGQELPNSSLPVTQRGSSTVLDITTLVTNMKTPLPALSPATFAMQMVGTPERLVLQKP